MKDFSYITNQHPSFVENLYQEYLKNPESVDVDFKKFFEGFDFAVANNTSSVSNQNSQHQTVVADGSVDWMREIKVYRLILGYRNKGHLLAKTNPIRPRKDRGANLNLSFFGLSEADLDTTFNAGNLIGLGATTLRNIVAKLEKVYASHVGIEFKYISNQKKIDWLTEQMEQKFDEPLSFDKSSFKFYGMNNKLLNGVQTLEIAFEFELCIIK